MSFTRQDVINAKRRLEQEIPGAIITDYGDYGYRLEVTWPGLEYCWIIYRPERRDIGQSGIEPTDLSVAIRDILKEKP